MIGLTKNIGIFLLLLAVNMYAQPGALIQTKDQNKKWLWDLEMLPLKDQIEKVQQRMLLDTSSYIDAAFVTQKPALSGIRPRYFIDDVEVGICKGTPAEVLHQLNSIISSTTSMKIMPEEQATMVYGLKASGGVILFLTNDKKSEEKLRKLKLTDNSCDQ